MKMMTHYRYALLSVVMMALGIQGAEPRGVGRYATFAEWQAACAKLPTNRVLKRSLPPREVLPLTAKEFNLALDDFLGNAQKGPLGETNAWLGRPPESGHFFNTSTSYSVPNTIRFEPFAQRLVIPPTAEVLFHGDFHGDIHSLNGVLSHLESKGKLKDFKILNPTFWMVFLGDYTDRGLYGVEVIHTLLRLRKENPDRVILVRGNHEDIQLVTSYGFAAEAQFKYGKEFDLRKTSRIYDFMPTVLYVASGSSAIQCNHGGMEPGYSPKMLLDAPSEIRYQMLNTLQRGQFIASSAALLQQFTITERALLRTQFSNFTPESPTRPSVLGFMWNDFSIVRGGPQFSIDPGRAYVFGDRFTSYILEKGSGEKRKLSAVFRAHQHSSIPNPMMRRLIAGRGIFRHWQTNDNQGALEETGEELAKRIETADSRSIPEGSVWTFNVAPDSVYGEGCGFSFDTFGILRTGPVFADWRVEVVNLAQRF